MQSRILTRCTIIPVFLFTCFLTMDVVAKERDLAPLLTPDAWQLISKASAYRNGFTPAEVTPFQLEQRKLRTKAPLTKVSNSRVKVKFADDLKIRLDSKDNPYSLTGLSGSTIADLTQSLGIRLIPVHSASLETIEKLTRRAEEYSHKQQPDLAGIYWLDGNQTAVDYAAQILHTMDEVEWIFYKPYLVRKNSTNTSTTNMYGDSNRFTAPKASAMAPTRTVNGACWYSNNDCENNTTKVKCESFGGTFLGSNSVCNTTQKELPQFDVPYTEGWCGAAVTPEVAEYRYRMIDDGTWDKYRLRDLNNLRGGTQYVKVTIHIVRYQDGTGGISLDTVEACLDDLNAAVADIDLIFCQEGLTLFFDCDRYADMTVVETSEIRVIESVPNTLNVYFVPEVEELCGISSFPGMGGVQGIVMNNNCTNNGFGGFNDTFVHEVGHYFGLYHTHEIANGIECVQQINCSSAGDGFCDTFADPGLGGLVDPFCNYTGTAIDPCGSGCFYDTCDRPAGPCYPPVLNFMSYADPCSQPQIFTPEQLSAFISTAENERQGHLRAEPCEPPGTPGPATECDPSDPPGPGPGDAICCLYEVTYTSGGDIGPGCIDTDEETCLNYNGIYMPAEKVEPPERVCDDYADCPEGKGPFFDDYNECGIFDTHVTYFTGDCYIDQTTYAQYNRNPDSFGCLDTPAELINGNFVVRTGAPTGGGNTVFEDQTCCETITANVPWCEENNWDAICASYANVYALTTGDCQRTQETQPAPSGCSGVFGTVQGDERQPTVVTGYVGTLIDITVNTLGGINFQMELVTSPYNESVLYLYFDGVGTYTYLGDTISNVATWIEATALEHGVNVTASCCAWTGCCDDTPSPPLNCENALIACEQAATSLGSFPLTTITDSVSLNALFINGNPLNGRCYSPLGPPSIARVRPNPSNGTPNFAQMGLLTWMTEETVPVWDTQIQPYPSATTNLSIIEVVELQQLLAWPMGGALGLGLGGDNYLPPVVGPSDQVVSWSGVGLDLFPDAPNSGGFGNHSVYRGAYGYAQSFEDRGVGINGAYGNNVKVAVIDWSAHLQEQISNTGLDLGGVHEELTHVILEGEATGHEPVELIFDENLSGPWAAYSADQGTAILGVIGAQWGPNSAPGIELNTRLENNLGVLGMVPDAELYFFPLATIEHPTGRQENAWLNAITTLDNGDIICAAYQPIGTNDIQPNLNYWSDTNLYLELANNVGICTVIKAGDNGIDLGSLEPDGGDQGAIVATAVSPGPPYKRWANGTQASNYTTTGDYAKVTVSGWGMGVTACGKGPNRDNYLGYVTMLYDDPTNAHDVHRFAYTNNFGNTAAAAAVAAGSAASLQGFTKQIFEIPMGPPIIRQLIAGGKFQLDKDGNSVMLFRDPNTDLDASDCAFPPEPLTWDMCNFPEGAVDTPWMTGSLANPRGSFLNAVHNPVFETPNISEIIVIRGNYLEGNKNSVSTRDTIFFSLTPAWVHSGLDYSVPTGVPGGNVHYRGNGLTTDIYLSGVFDAGIPPSDRLDLTLWFAPTTPSIMFVTAFMWDFYTNEWRPSADAVLPQGSEDVYIEINNAHRYIHPTTHEYHLRIVTLGNNSIDTPQLRLPVFYDQIRFSGAPVSTPLP